MPTIMTSFSDPNATIKLVLWGKRNCANDHSELKYFGKSPTTYEGKIISIQKIMQNEYCAKYPDIKETFQNHEQIY